MILPERGLRSYLFDLRPAWLCGPVGGKCEGLHRTRGCSVGADSWPG